MHIEKTEHGYRIHHAAGGFTELWCNYSGSESAACAAIDYLIDHAKHIWAEAYKQGVEDERTSEANIGIAGFNTKVNPARQNPYAVCVRVTHNDKGEQTPACGRSARTPGCAAGGDE